MNINKGEMSTKNGERKTVGEVIYSGFRMVKKNKIVKSGLTLEI